jgi:hypothetical protein
MDGSKFNPELHDKAVIVQLSCSFSWGTVTDKQITEETNTNKGAAAGVMHVRKKLLPDAAGVQVKALQAVLSEFYKYHTSRTFSTVTDGQRLMPTAFHFEYMEKFAEADAKAQSAMDDLESGYEASIELAKGSLVNAFKADDYPDVSEIRRYYKFSHQFLPVPSGNAIMRALGASVAADVDTYVGHILTSAATDAKDRLRKIVTRMHEQCQPKGKVYDSTFDAIDELVATLPALAGLTADPELTGLLKAVKENLSGFDAKSVRDNPAMRSVAEIAATEIMRRMG